MPDRYAEAALTPRRRINLVRYHGVLAPRAAWRKGIVPAVSVALRGHGFWAVCSYCERSKYQVDPSV